MNEKRYITVPVSPYISADGEIQSLLNIGSGDEIKRSDFVPGRTTKGKKITQGGSKLTIDVAASLGYGALVDVNASVNTQFYTYELLVEEDPVNGAENSLVHKEIYSTGIRIVIKAWGFEVNSSFELGFVAAKASSSTVSTTYQVDILGMDIHSLKSLPAFINSSTGPFTTRSLQTLGTIAAEFKELYKNPDAILIPQLSAVELDINSIKNPYEETVSNAFAITQIGKWHRTYEEALQNKPTEVPYGLTINDTVVKNVYNSITMNSGVINATNVEEAAKILNCGLSAPCCPT